jgi:hypothetical protein
MQLGSPWKYEMAALLSQLGCVTLSTDIIERSRRGEPLTLAQQKEFDVHPVIAGMLLKKIPRLEHVSWMVAQQRTKLNSSIPGISKELALDAEILRVAIEFDDMKAKGMGDSEAVERLLGSSTLDPGVLRSLKSVGAASESVRERSVPISELTERMVLQEDVETNTDILIAVSGQELTFPQIVRLKNLHRRGEIPDELLVLCPGEPAETA